MRCRRCSINGSLLIWVKRATLQLSSWYLYIDQLQRSTTARLALSSYPHAHSLCCSEAFQEACFVRTNSSTRARAHAGFPKSFSSSCFTLNPSVLVLSLRIPASRLQRLNFDVAAQLENCNLNITAGWERDYRPSQHPFVYLQCVWLKREWKPSFAWWRRTIRFSSQI